MRRRHQRREHPGARKAGPANPPIPPKMLVCDWCCGQVRQGEHRGCRECGLMTLCKPCVPVHDCEGWQDIQRRAEAADTPPEGKRGR
jgi:hypothetical protein